MCGAKKAACLSNITFDFSSGLHSLDDLTNGGGTYQRLHNWHLP
jgi:hypothetical protein